MFTAKKEGQKCINAWMGLLIIASVCAIIGLAVFVEFQSPFSRSKRAASKSSAQAFSVQANQRAALSQNGNSIVF